MQLLQFFYMLLNDLDLETKIHGEIQQYFKQKIVQQNVQQKVHNNYVALLIKLFEFTKLVEYISF